MKQSGESEAISEPPPRTMIWIEKIAGAIAYGSLDTEQDLLISPLSASRCSFLKSSDPYNAFYRKRRDQYIAQIKDGTHDTQIPEICDFEPPPEGDQPPALSGASIPAGITLIELGVIKLTAQFVARYGIFFWQDLVGALCANPLFSFLKRQDRKFNFYNDLVLVYQRILKPRIVFPADTVLEGFFHYLQLYKLDDKVIDLQAFVTGVECFTHMDEDDGLLSATMPPPQPLSFTMTHPEMPPPTPAQSHQDQEVYIQHASTITARITLKQLGIIKLTAQYVARYGKHFRRELMMRAVMLPHFEFMFFHHGPRRCRIFMEPAEIRFQIFSILVEAYSCILMPCKKSRKKIDAAVVDGFFNRLQLEKLEEGSETTMIDLHALVAGVDYLAYMDVAEYSDIMPPPERLSVMMMNRPHPGVIAQLPRGPMPSDYGPLPRDSRALAPVSFLSPEELRIIKLTAQFAARFAMSFVDDLENRVSMNPMLQFLRVTDSRRNVFNWFMKVYSGVLKPSKKVKKSDVCMATAVEVLLFLLGTRVVTSVIPYMSGVDYFTSVDAARYPAVMDPHELLSVTMNLERQMHTGPKPTLLSWSFPSTCPDGVTPKELVIIKLTAVFVARYGVRICPDLFRKLDMKSELKFLDPADKRFPLYKAVVDAYSTVLENHDPADTKVVVQRYIRCLEEGVPVDWRNFSQAGVPIDVVEEQERVVRLNAFVESVDCFAQMEDDHYSALMGNPLRGMPGMSFRPLPEEPEPKRGKLDETARAPQDKCFARGSSRIRVSVPALGASNLIEITGKPLSEKVASLKEKIAAVIHMPLYMIKLSGKVGVLKDDRSLADNNVAPGEVLKLSWFISKWSGNAKPS